MDGTTNNKLLRNSIAAMKAGKVLSNALGTSPTDTPDVPIPKLRQTIGDKDKDGGGGKEEKYEQSDQPNGGSMSKPGPRTARSGAYIDPNKKQITG